MFEKSLYDLIRGLRNHKGTEREYIRGSLRECRSEVKGQDMDVKATALLKLVYLEMFGYDMSWAAFHVLEVMSSPKYQHKRVGYLAAVQSFRSDTEVLMLATNLLKKDLTSSSPTVVFLPLVTLPHVITQSLAMSLLSDLLPRLTHQHATIRKKTIVTLYRLALVYPETLKPAWPKIKERLMDDKEDSSVTAAIVNVVCELGWRRPQDILPLAPRLFELLVDGGNNWMAIKIIKLFATLTPLEPRLVRKLLPPLITIIKTTPAMSLLYECINGIILGGILKSCEGTTEGDEVANLCLGKLRGMIVVEGDPNLKYVALLAFDKIVSSHPYLVGQHQDVILSCIDDPDISIRLRGLDLLVGMVNRDNLVEVISRLMKQLRYSPAAANTGGAQADRSPLEYVEPSADDEDEDPEEGLSHAEKKSDQTPLLPEDYRIELTRKVLEMCSRRNYENVEDFFWYIDILVELARYAPSPPISKASIIRSDEESVTAEPQDIGSVIGSELLNVAVRVKDVRQEATAAAESLISTDLRNPGSGLTLPKQGVLRSSAWILGEYAHLLSSPTKALDALLRNLGSNADSETLCASVQAVAKVVARLCGNENTVWSSESSSVTTLTISKVCNSLETLVSHPDLDVQERAVEFLELMRLCSEAAQSQDASAGAPLLLTQAMPSLFVGMDLNPVAPGAQKKVPLSDELDLDTPINSNLSDLLMDTGFLAPDGDGSDDAYQFYNKRPQSTLPQVEPAAKRLEEAEEAQQSYQQSSTYLDPEILSKRLADRKEKNRDDPFYIASDDSGSGRATPLHKILHSSNGETIDIDSIPIMDLDLEDDAPQRPKALSVGQSPAIKPRPRPRFDITADETLAGDESAGELNNSDDLLSQSSRARAKKSLLQVDSSGLGSFSLDPDSSQPISALRDAQRKEEEEEEMAKAIREVERLRLEMQRASERVSAAKGVPPEGTVVKKKKKRAKAGVPANSDALPETKNEESAAVIQPSDTHGATEKKRKKKKVKKEVAVAQELADGTQDQR